MEVRSYSFSGSQNDAGNIIEGHAAVFDSPTVIGGQFIETIERSAFSECDLSDVALFVSHDTAKLPLARATRGGGTMKIWVDNIGLAMRAELDVENSPAAKELYSSIRRGDIKGMSFTFIVDDDEWQNLDSEMPTRRIKKISRVYEVSAVSYPAYEGTDISARAKEIKKEARKLDYTTFKNFMEQYKRDKDEEIDERTRTINEAIEAEERAKRAKDVPPEYIPGKGFIPAENRHSVTYDSQFKQREKAGKELKENRAVISHFNALGEKRTMMVEGNESILIPSTVSSSIKPDFEVVSSFIDVVSHLSLNGGESFKQPYITDIAAGDYTREGEDAKIAETAFGYANINRCKITAYAELTEELQKLPNAAYAEVVFQNIRTSIREVLAKEILFGKGVENDESRIVGIFSNKATAIDPDTDIGLSEITDTTLDEIVYQFGGKEDVETPCFLILNKFDLLAFSKVRTSTKQKFYEIHFTGGNSGTINGVHFITDSNCKPLTAAGTYTGDYCMCYGQPQNYQFVEFSPLEVKRSDDYKFRAGITCFKGSVFCGGNVTKKNGFLRIKKI